MTIRNLRLKAVAILLLFSGTLVHANSVRIFSLSADSWARPRAGEVLPKMDPVRLAISYWESGNDTAILLSYPGEDSGELWAAELKDWMVSLGVPSDYILLSPGMQVQDELHILVGNRLELNR